MMRVIKDLLPLKNLSRVEKIDYGWSTDEKYFVEEDTGSRYLLRISKLDTYAKKKKEFDTLRKFNSLNFTMSEAIAFDMSKKHDCVYMLLSWIEGEPLETAIRSLTTKEQYELGLSAGAILKNLHSLEVSASDLPTETKRKKKLLQLQAYEACAHRVPGDETAISYVKDNIESIDCLAPVYKHGDFHLGNLIYTPERMIGVIDFNRWECGDGYEEFYKVQSFDVEVSVPFSIGQIHGYFNGEPPLDFWKAQAVYVAHASLYSIKWAEAFGDEEINGMKKRCLEAFSDYNDFRDIIPRWYREPGIYRGDT